MSELLIMDETRVWLDGQEITSYLKRGPRTVTVVDGQVVYADTLTAWRIDSGVSSMMGYRYPPSRGGQLRGRTSKEKQYGA